MNTHSISYTNDIISLEGGVIMSVAKEIRRLRNNLKLTQDQFAKKIGVHGRQLARYEAGTNMPSIDILKKIADFYEVSIDRLVYGKDEYTSKRLRVSDQELLQLFRKIDRMKRHQREEYRWILTSLISNK